MVLQRKIFLIFMLTCFLVPLMGQEVHVKGGENCSPAWSPDGTQLVYQHGNGDGWDLYLYDLEKDSSYPLLTAYGNTCHPAWIPKTESLVFDSDTLGFPFLFKLNLQTGEVEPLFKRKVQAREAVFPQVARQVYFIGRINDREPWQVYSYDFVYDNLNKLTDNNSHCYGPALSPDNKLLLYGELDTIRQWQKVRWINWYGEEQGMVDTLGAHDATWYPDGLKVLWLSGKQGGPGRMYRQWKDGSHLAALDYKEGHYANPVISPDGQWIAIEVKHWGRSEILILPMVDDTLE